jgi:hypothetical protein
MNFIILKLYYIKNNEFYYIKNNALEESKRYILLKHWCTWKAPCLPDWRAYPIGEVYVAVLSTNGETKKYILVKQKS